MKSLDDLPDDELLTLEQALEYLPDDYSVAILKREIAFYHLIGWRAARHAVNVMVEDLRIYMREWKVLERPAPAGPFVYFAQDCVVGAVKVGTARNPINRLVELQVGNPHLVQILGVVIGGRITEMRYQKMFDKYALRGEWYEGNEIVLGVAQQAIKCQKRYGSSYTDLDPIVRSHAPHGSPIFREKADV